MARYSNSVPQILDGNGNPLVGAKKYFYEPGTTTLKTVYTDSALTIAQTNPVISDADGRFPDIFLDGSYKEEQKDANDVTLWTRDPVGDVVSGQLEIWLNDKTYNIPDIVKGSDNEYYRSISNSNQGNDPTASSTNWELLQFGRLWNSSISYEKGDSAYGSNGLLFISLVASNSGNNPISDTTNWQSADASRHAVAGGTADALTATFNPVLTGLDNAQEVRIRAASANATTTPTFAPDSLTAKTITKNGNQVLVSGDIFGAGHELILRYNASNDVWELLNPSPAILQVVKDQDGAVATGTTVLPHDDTIPQNTEGDEYLSIAITPKSANSSLVIDVTVHISHSSTSNRLIAALFVDSTANALAASHAFFNTATIIPAPITFRHIVSAGSTSARTYKVRAGSANAGTTTFNGEAGARKFGGVYGSSISVMEVTQ